ncbi:hypothetical protein [Streptomyces sp. WM6378]|uniref:hypothetical protein n=1 Tax=Streptomyces sp. WM6378 TaxID=1415557 RepID=UPI0006B05718|nr:hypothetical protein [Streptomyces sp. WM6378]KOU37617.1 hypothetical protein ADK54_31355 [Streptomyces sp. WM6378]
MTMSSRRSRLAAALRHRWASARARLRDDRGSATEWALITAAGGTLVGLVFVAINTKIGEKITTILGF